MCGIAGVVNHFKACELTSDMISVLKHRGPDHDGVIKNGNNAIGMCQLQIRSPLNKKEFIPYCDSNDNSWISYNGEVYNVDLKTGKQESLFIKSSLKNGTNHNSMSALAIMKNQNIEVELYRDSYGIKPLFIRQLSSDSQLFCSEIKPLMQTRYGSAKVRSNSIAETMCFGKPLGKHTMYKDVFSIAPGKITILNGTSIYEKELIEKYPEYKNDSSLRELIYDAVKDCLVGHRKIGLALSGGIDSTIIAYILNELGVEDVETISIIVEGTEDGVSDLKSLGLAEGGVWTKWNHSTINFTSHDFKKYMEQSVDTFGQPTYMTSLPLYYALAKSVRELGIVVLLTGEGADELFLGYNSYCNTVYTKGRTSDILKNHAVPHNKRRWLEKIIGNDQLYQSYTSFNREFSFCYLMNKCDAIRAMERRLSLEPLLQRVDHCLMKFSIEGRTPFLHNNIPYKASRYKQDELINHHITKIPLRRLCKEINLNNIVLKPKIPFRLPILDWFNTSLEGWFNEMLESNMVIFKDLGLNSKAIREMKKAVAYRDTCATSIGYMLITIGIWMKKMAR